MEEIGTTNCKYLPLRVLWHMKNHPHSLYYTILCWTMLDSYCSTCKVYVFGDDGLPHRLQFSVNGVTSSSISVQGHNYKVHNIVSHHGPSALSCHYTFYHKQNRRWMLVDDSDLSRTSKPGIRSDVNIPNSHQIITDSGILSCDAGQE